MIPSPEIHVGAVLPLLAVAGGAFLLLVLDLLLAGAPRYKGTVLSLASAATLALTLAIACAGFAAGGSPEFSPAHPMFQLDRLANFGVAVIAMGALLSVLLSTYYLREVGIDYGEYYVLLLLATSGMVLLVGAVDLVTVFLGIELLSIPIYVLAGFDRRKLRSNESALKYFLAGSFASALMLYGMALLYGATGETSYSGIAGYFAENLLGPLALIGLGLVLVGFTFKISSVPFHQWTPDVYEGAPAAVTAYMSVTVKAAAFVALVRLAVATFGPVEGPLTNVLWWLAAATMVLGNLMAVIQDNVKRMLAYSSVAHAGYLLIGLVAASPGAYGEAFAAVLFYLLAYAFTNLGAFGVVVALAHNGQDAERFEEYAGLAKRRPALAALMTLFLISLAGIPGTAGFIGKFLIFSAAVERGLATGGSALIVLVVIAVLNSAISLGYYLRVVATMYFHPAREDARPGRAGFFESAVLFACAAAVLLLGLLPQDALPGISSLLQMADVNVLQLASDAAATLGP